MPVPAALHDYVVHGRRVRRLVDLLSAEVPRGTTSLLDVGCGDGRITRAVGDRSPGMEVTGLDVFLRAETAVPVTLYDGDRLPFDDNSYDVVMMVDVLHHSDEPQIVLGEARRVARQAVLIKDHCLDGALAYQTLRLMDWVGNAQHSVALPYNYWPRARWFEACNEMGLTVATWHTKLGLYPAPFRPLFERSLHFVARLDVPADGVPLVNGSSQPPQ